MFKVNPKKLNFDQKILSSSSSSGDIFAYQNNEYDDAWMMKKINVDSDFNNLLQRVQEIVLGFNQSHHNILPISGYDIQPVKSGGWEIYLRLQRMKTCLKDVLIDFHPLHIPNPRNGRDLNRQKALLNMRFYILTFKYFIPKSFSQTWSQRLRICKS